MKGKGSQSSLFWIQRRFGGIASTIVPSSSMTLLSTIRAITSFAIRTRCNSKLHSNIRSPTTSISFTTTSKTTTSATTMGKTTLKRQTCYHLDRRYLTTSAQLPPKNDESVVSWSSILLEIVAGYCLAILVVPVYIIDVMKCDGPSMYPLFHPKGDIIVVEKLTHRWYGIQDGDKGQVRAWNLRKRQQEQSTTQSNHTTTSIHGVTYGDVVVVEHPLREGTVCKRIVALPGDHVIVPRRPAPTTVRVPDGHIWLEGDNKENSTDSRSYGPVPAPLIVGVVRLRLWPVRGEAFMNRRCPDSSNPLPKNHNSTENTIVIPAGSS